MTDRSVRDVLKQLQQTLESRQPLSDTDRELLRQLSADIHAALERADTGGHASLAERLQAAVTRFEVTHPDLTATMARAAKTLADMGI